MDSIVAKDDPIASAVHLRAEREASKVQEIRAWCAWLQGWHASTLALSDAELEAWPDVVRWLFPTGAEDSAGSPGIGRDELRMVVQSDPWLEDAIRQSFNRFAQVLGLVVRDGSLEWRYGQSTWALRATKDWRVDRILNSIWNAGLGIEAEMLIRFLKRELIGDARRAQYCCA